MTRLVLSIACLYALSSCGPVSNTLEKLNPFSSPEEIPPEASQEDPDAFARTPAMEDGKISVDRVENARLDYTASGAIVRAEGLLSRQGHHSATLRPLNFGLPDGNGVIWYEFRVSPPQGPSATSLQTVSVGGFIPNARLRNALGVTIAGAQNDVTIRIR